MLIIPDISKHIGSLIIPAALALIVVGCLGISAVFVLASLFILLMGVIPAWATSVALYTTSQCRRGSNR
jgi:hypothetical protein